MNFHLEPETKESIKAFSISGMIIVLFFVLLTNLKLIGEGIATVAQVLTPFLLGIIFSFILMPLRDLVEHKLLKDIKWKQKAKRKVSVLVSMIVMLFVIVAFFAILIPQLVSSVSTFAGNIGSYMDNAQQSLELIFNGDTALIAKFTSMVEDVVTEFSTWLASASGGITTIVTTIGSFVSGIINFFIGIIITMYILAGSERFKMQIKKVLYAVFSNKNAERISYVFRLTAEMFYRFIFGKGIDSLIIGIICYIGCLILRIPYAVMIGFIVGITNMIPVFGPFIGAIPCAVILVMINWVKSLEFLIFILVLQQFDGNILGPYILGDAVGLPTLWVMFAIIVGGSLFGIVGMFAGVPAFAVIYTLIRQWTYKRLKEKNLDASMNRSNV